MGGPLRCSGAFGQYAPRLLALGYCVVPIAPGTKAPGVCSGKATEADVSFWHGRGRPDRAPAVGVPIGRKLPGWPEFTVDYLLGEHRHVFAAWCRAPHTGIGVLTGAVSGGLVAIDLDTSDPRAIAELEGIPGLEVSKTGAKGKTRFFRYEAGDPLPSESLPGLLDVLSDGRQTVIPPTIHPNGSPYRWTGQARLDELEPQDLPLLRSQQLAEFIDALARLGLGTGRTSTRTRGHGGASGGGTGLYGEVNRRAMAALDLWVPDLNLIGLRRTGEGAYVAVATWRASSSGRSLDKRSSNLSIHPNGIVDFGTGTGYTPIDLVSLSKSLEPGEAMTWLLARVGPELPPWEPLRLREAGKCSN